MTAFTIALLFTLAQMTEAFAAPDLNVPAS
jgi:hypothetical protein